ncbi:MAG TPA: hypothetical protein VD926_04640, partial [Acidimicrobiales bacterium]|nr:hypothetical protein [Acidimicrobiales bacterium]
MADRVCFVSHEATLTGAPMSLLQLLRWLRANSDLALEVIVLERGDDGGRLLADFEAVAPTAVAGAGDLPVGRLSEVDVLYLNSVFSARALDGLGAGAYVIARVPELGMVFRHHLPAEDRDHLLRRANRFIAVSDRVRAMLVDDLDVAPEKVVRIHGFVDPAAFEGATPAAGRAVRRELGIPEDAAVVGGSGTTDWRKGPDLFV